jgi:DNA polymerase III delta subunit
MNNKQIYVYHGKNTFNSQIAAQAKLRELSAKGGVVKFADETTDITFSGVDLFNEGKIWFIKRFFSIETNRAKALWEEMQLFRDLEIILWEDKPIDKRLKIYKDMTTSKVNMNEFIELNTNQAREWLRQEIEKHGLESDSMFIEGFVSKVGSNQHILSNEILKLKFLLLSDGREILRYEDLSVVSDSKLVDTWDFVEAFYTKNKSKAIRLLEIFDFDGGKEIELLGAVASVLKNIYLVLKYRMNVDNVSRELNIHPFAMRNAKQYANYFNLNRIEKLYEQILNLDYSFKRSEIEPKMGFGLLTASL